LATSRDRLPSEAIAPHSRTGRSLLGKAIARDGWRVVQSDDRDVANPVRAPNDPPEDESDRRR